MAKRRPDIVRLSSPADLACAVVQLLGFRPSESVVILCAHGVRGRLGLVLRFDLDAADWPEPFAEAVAARVRHQRADGAFVVIFSDAAGARTHRPLIDALATVLGARLVQSVLVNGDRLWNADCEGSCCGAQEGIVIDRQSAAATSMAAAYALSGQATLPDRAAVVRSVALDLDSTGQAAMRSRIEVAALRHRDLARGARRLEVRALLERLLADRADPRTALTDGDVAELAALTVDVVVRDEVLVRAGSAVDRVALLPLLRDVARRTPPPYDAPTCSMLAWAAYLDGDGVVANVALDRALASDPDYSLALLIVESLARQVSPERLADVVRGAARALEGRDAAG